MSSASNDGQNCSSTAVADIHFRLCCCHVSTFDLRGLAFIGTFFQRGLQLPSCLSTFLPGSVPSPWLGGVVPELPVLTAPTSPTGKRWRVTTRRAWRSNPDSNFCSASSQLSQSSVSPWASSSATTTASSSLFLATSWEFHLPTFP